MQIDLNADLGEEVTDDAALLAVVTSANVACGFHAGTPDTMARVCARAAGLGVRIGAHVSYRDRENFGRVPHDVAPGVLTEQVAEQVAALAGHARAAGVEVRYLKPHGALYHRVGTDAEQATAVLDGVAAAGLALPVLGMPGELEDQARSRGLVTRREGFPDRGYTAAGTLVPRHAPGALVTDTAQIVANALDLATRVDSLCLHGDSPGAVEHAVAVRQGLTAAGWQVRSW